MANRAYMVINTLFEGNGRKNPARFEYHHMLNSGLFAAII
jgi:hypothetical protein